jgi:UDP-glucose 4-epimerase
MGHLLVAGGAGYIGANFVKYLLDHTDDHVTVVDNLSTGRHEAVKALGNRFGSRFTFLLSDLGNAEKLHPLLHKNPVDGVFHFGAFSLVGESQYDPLKYYYNNVAQTLALLKTVVEHEIRYFIFSSSAAVYGIPEKIPVKEDALSRPINHYGKTKAMTEEILAALSGREDFVYASLRYFNVAGTDEELLTGECHDPETHLIPIAVKTAMDKRDHMALFGTDYETRDGTAVRDYIHVTDLCEAHWAAFKKIRKSGDPLIVNLGSARGYSVKEVLETVKDVTGKDFKIIEEGRRPGDPPVLIASSEKAKTELGWTAKRSLEEMIVTAWEWEKKSRK